MRSNIGDFVRARLRSIGPARDASNSWRQGVLMTIREDYCIIDTAFGEFVVSPEGIEVVPYESQSEAVREFVERCRARTPFLSKD